jgi:antitoxin MazE
MKVKVAKWGNSLGLRLPKGYVDDLGLKPGSIVDLEKHGSRLAIETAKSAKIPYYRLEDLLAEIDRLGPESVPETVDWGPDRGSEIIDDEYSRGEITLDDILSGRLRDKQKNRDTDDSGGR